MLIAFSCLTGIGGPARRDGPEHRALSITESSRGMLPRRGNLESLGAASAPGRIRASGRGAGFLE
ncbi:hypothetical protein GCM10028801_13040 [Nocardioides maradonensis]